MASGSKRKSRGSNRENELPSRKRRLGKEHVLDEDTVVKERRSKNRHEVLSYQDNIVTRPIIEVDSRVKPPKQGYPNLKNRTCPYLLANAIEMMNATQRAHVVQMGFGSILGLKIKDVPPKISYWVMDNFNCNRSEIRLEGGLSFRVNEEDVRLMLGLPRGNIRIERKIKNQDGPMTKKWRDRFTKSKFRILPKDVVDDMLSLVDGGKWFKRQFLVLVTCCLIESSCNGYVSPQIIDSFYDVASVDQLNWCEYVMRCLIEHTLEWKENKEKYYNGPSLFITLLYVDRVVLGYRTVPRSFPAFIAWNNGLLQRQKDEIHAGGFGKGYVDEPSRDQLNQLQAQYIPPPIEQDLQPQPEVPAQPDQEDVIEDANIGDDAEPVDNVQHDDVVEAEEEAHDPLNNELSEDTNDVRLIVKQIVIEGQIVAAAMSRIMNLVKRVPDPIRNNLVFKKIVEASLVVDKEKYIPSTSQQSFTQDDLQFWDCQEHLDALAKMEKEALKINELKKELGIPSFSLGFNQEWGSTLEVAREVVEMDAIDKEMIDAAVTLYLLEHST